MSVSQPPPRHPEATDSQTLPFVLEKLKNLQESVGRSLIGKEEVVKLALIPLFCRGHLLIEDVPGVGKTTLAKSLARGMDLDVKRLQFTPDLLPQDITGSYLFNQKTQDFEFKPGPIFTHILLTDEINRATPRTQSALLECMEEFQVSLEGHPHLLPNPFFVIATQNPIEQSGTFQLPETQLDRFLLKIQMGYPTEEEEASLLDYHLAAGKREKESPVMNVDDLQFIRESVDAVFIDPALKSYAASLVRSTRVHPSVTLGVSPRGTVALLKSAKALALLSGQSFVTPDHIKFLTEPVFAHRLMLRPQALMNRVTAADVVKEILATVEVPIDLNP